MPAYRIGFIEPHLQCVGGIRHIVEVAERLRLRGHSVKIYTPMGRKCSWLLNEVPGRKLDRVTKDTNDFIIFNLAEQYKVALVANAPVKVFWVLAPEMLYRGPASKVAFRPEFHYVANSQFTARYTQDRIKLPYTVPVVGAGVNPLHFRYDPKIRKDKDILFYGSDRPWKGTAIIREAIKGFNYWQMEGKNTPQTEMHTLYNRSKVFVSAGLAEGFNMPILEAMACGAAVVCTSDGGSRDFVTTGKNALVVPQRESDAIRKSVALLLRDDKYRNKLIKAGLTTASESRFTWDSVTTTFETELLAQVTKF